MQGIRTLLVDELFATGVVVVLTTDVNAVDFDVDVRLIVAGVRLVCREDSGMALACGFCTAVCALIGVFTGVVLPNCKYDENRVHSTSPHNIYAKYTQLQLCSP